MHALIGRLDLEKVLFNAANMSRSILTQELTRRTFASR